MRQFMKRRQWGIIALGNPGYVWNITSSRTESIKAFVGSEEGYAKRWRKVKKWNTQPRVIPVSISWEL